MDAKLPRTKVAFACLVDATHFYTVCSLFSDSAALLSPKKGTKTVRSLSEFIHEILSFCFVLFFLLLFSFSVSLSLLFWTFTGYAGVLCADLNWVSDRNKAGYVAGWLQSSNVFGRVLMSSIWGYIAARYGFDVVLAITLVSLFLGGLL